VYIIVVSLHNTALNSSDNLHSCPPGIITAHGDVYWTGSREDYSLQRKRSLCRLHELFGWSRDVQNSRKYKMFIIMTLNYSVSRSAVVSWLEAARNSRRRKTKHSNFSNVLRIIGTGVEQTLRVQSPDGSTFLRK